MKPPPRRPDRAPGSDHSAHRAGPARRPVPARAVQPGVRLLVGMRRSEHHALADTELHLARRQVGDHHRQLADEALRRMGRGDPENTVRGAASPMSSVSSSSASSPRRGARRRSWRCAGRPWQSRRCRFRGDRLAAGRHCRTAGAGGASRVEHLHVHALASGARSARPRALGGSVAVWFHASRWRFGTSPPAPARAGWAR